MGPLLGSTRGQVFTNSCLVAISSKATLGPKFFREWLYRKDNRTIRAHEKNTTLISYINAGKDDGLLL